MKAMIFAAGLGTRLKPLTDNLPKALAPVAGRTLLYHLLMRLRNAGVDEFVVNVHHFADKIISYVSDTPELAALNIVFSDERDMLRDTGGGIRYARPLLLPDELASPYDIPASGQIPINVDSEHSSSCRVSEYAPGDDLDGNISRSMSDCFLLHNVDIVSDLDIKWFQSYGSGTSRPALATLLVSRRKTSRYLLFDSDMRLVGWTNTSTGEVRTPFRELDLSQCSLRAFGGIHLISNEIFSAFDTIDTYQADFPLYSFKTPAGIVEGPGFHGEEQLSLDCRHAAECSSAAQSGSGYEILPASLQPIGQCFPIMDFYLRAAAVYPIYGAEPESLTLIDAGRPDTLAVADDFLRQSDAGK